MQVKDQRARWNTVHSQAFPPDPRKQYTLKTVYLKFTLVAWRGQVKDQRGRWNTVHASVASANPAIGKKVCASLSAGYE